MAGVPVSFPHTRRGRRRRGRRLPARLRRPRRSCARACCAPGSRRWRHPTTRRRCSPPTRPAPSGSPPGRSGRSPRTACRPLYAAVPIGYRVESYSPARARVLTWGFTLLGNASRCEPAAYFGLTHTELVWSDGRWRIAETRGGFGPTPKLATPPGPLGGYRRGRARRSGCAAMSSLRRALGAAPSPRCWRRCSCSPSPRRRPRGPTSPATSAGGAGGRGQRRGRSDHRRGDRRRQPGRRCLQRGHGRRHRHRRPPRSKARWKGSATAIFDQITSWVADGASWLIGQVASVIE